MTVVDDATGEQDWSYWGVGKWPSDPGWSPAGSVLAFTFNEDGGRARRTRWRGLTISREGPLPVAVCRPRPGKRPSRVRHEARRCAQSS